MLRRNKKKIEIATPDEVAEFAAASADAAVPAGASGPESESADPEAADMPASTEAEQWKDKYLRVKAEMRNFQRRSEQAKSDAIRFANADFARNLLGVLDDVERALAHAGGEGANVAGDVQALQLIYDSFLKVLRQYQVEPIESLGQPFDPACHEAMMQQPSDAHPEPTVLQELQRGYRLHERVLRPAKVIVSKPPESAVEAADAAGDGDATEVEADEA